jgi:hypothetical protein
MKITVKTKSIFGNPRELHFEAKQQAEPLFGSGKKWHIGFPEFISAETKAGLIKRLRQVYPGAKVIAK